MHHTALNLQLHIHVDNMIQDIVYIQVRGKCDKKVDQLMLRMKRMMRTIVGLVIMEKVSWSLSCAVGTRR